jgi:hypothetical protein
MIEGGRVTGGGNRRAYGLRRRKIVSSTRILAENCDWTSRVHRRMGRAGGENVAAVDKSTPMECYVGRRLRTMK